MYDTNEVRELEKTLSNLEKELAELNARVPATTSKSTATVTPEAFDTRFTELRKSGLSPTKAMEAARREDPARFQKHQDGETLNFEQLVAREMAKGCMTRSVAEQRVATIYGLMPDASMSKASGAFLEKVAEVMARDKCSRAAAMTTARQEHPALFKQYRAGA